MQGVLPRAWQRPHYAGHEGQSELRMGERLTLKNRGLRVSSETLTTEDVSKLLPLSTLVRAALASFAANGAGKGVENSSGKYRSVPLIAVPRRRQVRGGLSDAREEGRVHARLQVEAGRSGRVARRGLATRVVRAQTLAVAPFSNERD